MFDFGINYVISVPPPIPDVYLTHAEAPVSWVIVFHDRRVFLQRKHSLQLQAWR